MARHEPRPHHGHDHAHRPDAARRRRPRVRLRHGRAAARAAGHDREPAHRDRPPPVAALHPAVEEARLEHRGDRHRDRGLPRRRPRDAHHRDDRRRVRRAARPARRVPPPRRAARPVREEAGPVARAVRARTRPDGPAGPARAAGQARHGRPRTPCSSCPASTRSRTTWAPPTRPSPRLVDAAALLKGTKLKVADVDFLLRHADPTGKLTPTPAQVERDLSALRNALTAVDAELAVPAPTADLGAAAARDGPRVRRRGRRPVPRARRGHHDVRRAARHRRGGAAGTARRDRPGRADRPVPQHPDLDRPALRRDPDRARHRDRGAHARRRRGDHRTGRPHGVQGRAHDRAPGAPGRGRRRPRRPRRRVPRAQGPVRHRCSRSPIRRRRPRRSSSASFRSCERPCAAPPCAPRSRP